MRTSKSGERGLLHSLLSPLGTMRTRSRMLILLIGSWMYAFPLLPNSSDILTF